MMEEASRAATCTLARAKLSGYEGGFLNSDSLAAVSLVPYAKVPAAGLQVS